jgi:integrase
LTRNYRSRGGTDYCTTVRQSFLEAFGKTQAASVTLDKIDAYFRERLAQRWNDGRPRIGDSTIRKECIAAGKMFKWAGYRGLVPFNPFLEYEKPRESAGSPAPALTYDEEDAVAALLPPLERDTFLFALDSGMRIGEIRALTGPRIDRAAGVIHVDATKTGRLRTVPLSPSDRPPAILDRHPQRTTTAVLFHDLYGKPLERDRINRLLEGVMKTAGVPTGALPHETGAVGRALESSGYCSRYCSQASAVRVIP